MKSVLYLIAAAAFAVTLHGQENNPREITSGKITYQEKVKLDITIEGEASPMAGMLPREHVAEKVLTFNEEATLFEDGNRNVEEEMSSQHGEDGAVRFRMVVSGENKLFTDLKNRMILDQRDFMNRIFLVEKEFPESGWKIADNQKVILGFPCVEAVRTDTAGKKIVAWFAPSIAISSGPAGLCNLPGMILEADFNEGQRIYTAISVEPGDWDLKKPGSGKKVTEQEFNAIAAEKMKEMGIEQGGEEGGARMRIVIKHQ